MKKYVKIFAEGHPNVKATHRTTFEITKDNYLTPRGDCIIGINATHSVSELPTWFKEYLLQGKKVKVILKVEGTFDVIYGQGSKYLKLSNNRSMVFRKSEYIDDRTVIIKANKAAKDIDRELVKKLKDGKKLEVILIPMEEFE